MGIRRIYSRKLFCERVWIAVKQRLRDDLAQGVEEFLFSAAVVQRLTQDFPRQDTAFATLARNPKGVADIFERVCPVLDSGADLTVGDSFAETNVHTGAEIRWSG